jgi:hypothetical protein
MRVSESMETPAVNVQSNIVCNALWTSTCALHVPKVTESTEAHVLHARIHIVFYVRQIEMDVLHVKIIMVSMEIPVPLVL